MKSETTKKELKLNKITISVLDAVEMVNAKGGCPPPSERNLCPVETIKPYL